MAVSALKRLLVAMLLLVAATDATACFGPKLYLGYPESQQGKVLAELVALYVKEKTGVESILVPLEGKDAAAEIVADRLDLGVADGVSLDLPDLLAVDGVPVLLSGKRPQTDLQFTTVVPAIRKLARQMDAEIFAGLVRDVAAGEPVKARVRRLLMERAWI